MNKTNEALKRIREVLSEPDDEETIAKIREALAEQEKQEPEIGDVFFICDAYESGFGHGAKNDGLNDGSIFSDSRHGEAYELGYAVGLKRSNQ